MSPVPDDVRARILSLFPKPAAVEHPSPAQLRAASLAAPPDRPARSLAQTLAGIDAASLELGDYARWIVQTGDREPVPLERGVLEREIRATMAALRVLSYRRESGLLEGYLDEHPTDERARRRVLDLTIAVRDIDRRFPGAAQRAALELAREATAPARRAPIPRPDLDAQGERYA
jgi:hypothetical protein